MRRYKPKLVYVELNDSGRVTRVFRGYPPIGSGQKVRQQTRTTAVAEIRQQVFRRANGNCEYCAAIITSDTGHMHEKVFRSRGGEISLDNSVAICHDCHRGEHGLGKGVT